MASKMKLRKEIKKWKRKYKRKRTMARFWAKHYKELRRYRDRNGIWEGSDTTDQVLIRDGNASEALMPINYYVDRNATDGGDGLSVKTAFNDLADVYRDVDKRCPGPFDVIFVVEPQVEDTDGA